MLSDHGFERLDKDVFVSFVLKEQGFLTFERGSSPDLRTLAHGTRAFALDPARIYVNLEDKYPNGSVEAADRDGVIKDLERVFGTLEIDGKKVIKRVYRKEELYEGPLVDRAPDLVLLANEGFNLRANLKAKQLWGKDAFTGKHSQSDAFLLVWGNIAPDSVPETPCVSDVVGIINN
jgi:predicted AlkP superfamily phosphohydrolase/phosphomutase